MDTTSDGARSKRPATSPPPSSSRHQSFSDQLDDIIHQRQLAELMATDREPVTLSAYCNYVFNRIVQKMHETMGNPTHPLDGVYQFEYEDIDDTVQDRLLTKRIRAHIAEKGYNTAHKFWTDGCNYSGTDILNWAPKSLDTSTYNGMTGYQGSEWRFPVHAPAPIPAPAATDDAPPPYSP